MSEQFICISCWKEFSASPEDVTARGGKVVCPLCGYVQTSGSDVDAVVRNPAHPQPKLENPATDLDKTISQEVPWASVTSEDEDLPISEEEHTDRVEIAADVMLVKRDSGPQDEVSFDSGEADEPTPLEPIRLPGSREPSAGVLVRDMNPLGQPGKAPAQPRAVAWQLKTPSGLTFKFTDPEALLGWKKKLATYKELHVSPDGERWVDFARFVREFEELGDPVKAFILSSSLGDADLPPPTPVDIAEDVDSAEQTGEDVRESGRGSRPSASQTTTGVGFTFKVKEEREAGWGRYLLFAILGVGLGAGIIMAVLYLTGNWTPIP
jgi:DNA-directed RNA polymerase subunit RPC12/RpoP